MSKKMFNTIWKKYDAPACLGHYFLWKIREKNYIIYVQVIVRKILF